MTPRPSGTLSRAQKHREAVAHANVFASRLRILEVFPSTGDEHYRDHDAQKKKRDISEMGQLWKHHPPIIRAPSNARSRAKAICRRVVDLIGDIPNHGRSS